MMHLDSYVLVLFIGVSSVLGQWDKPAGRRYTVSSASDISELQSQLKPGDYMTMRGGVWSGAKITLTANGEAGTGKMIYLMADKPGGTKLMGTSLIAINGRYIEVRDIIFEGDSPRKPTAVTFGPDSYKSRFTNSAILGFNRNDPPMAHWVEIWGLNNTVDYNTFERKIGPGQLVRVKTNVKNICKKGDMNASHGHKISRNFFGHRPETGVDNGEGIQIGLKECEFGYSDTLVEFNLFEGYGGEIESISVKATRNVLRYNTFRSSDSMLTLRHGDESRVEGNYFFCKGKDWCGGIRVHGDRHVIINNYIEGETGKNITRGSLLIHGGRDILKRAASDTLVERNVVYDCTNCLFIGQGAPKGNSNMRYNQNVVQGKTTSSLLIDEMVRETGATWTLNYFNRGKIQKTSRTGIIEKDPGFKYDSELKIYKPSVIDFTMKFPPLTRSEVGPTWKRS